MNRACTLYTEGNKFLFQISYIFSVGVKKIWLFSKISQVLLNRVFFFKYSFSRHPIGCLHEFALLTENKLFQKNQRLPGLKLLTLVLIVSCVSFLLDNSMQSFIVVCNKSLGNLLRNLSFTADCLRFPFKIFTYPSVFLIPSTLMRLKVPELLKHLHNMILSTMFSTCSYLRFVIGYMLLYDLGKLVWPALVYQPMYIIGKQ